MYVCLHPEALRVAADGVRFMSAPLVCSDFSFRLKKNPIFAAEEGIFGAAAPLVCGDFSFRLKKNPIFAAEEGMFARRWAVPPRELAPRLSGKAVRFAGK